MLSLSSYSDTLYFTDDYYFCGKYLSMVNLKASSKLFEMYLTSEESTFTVKAMILKCKD